MLDKLSEHTSGGLCMSDFATTAAPALPQHLQALKRANEVRMARSALKRSISAGGVSIHEVILGCPWEVDSMTIDELLQCQRRWGTTRTRKFLAGIGMPETKTIGSMTERQRFMLATLI
jgi:hypothetical protein